MEDIIWEKKVKHTDQGCQSDINAWDRKENGLHLLDLLQVFLHGTQFDV